LGRPFGEIKFAEYLEELRITLEDYYGGINQRRMGITPDKQVEKPYVAMLLEQMDRFDHLPERGSLNDQPHLLMRELELAKQIKTMFDNSYRAYLKSQQQPPQGIRNG
jgi:hypothetical protein